MRVEQILETCLCAADLAEIERFYTRVLGLAAPAAHTPRHLFFRCGNRMLLFFNPEESMQPGELPPHGTHGAGHLAFGVRAEEIPVWRTHLEAQGVPIESEYHWPGGQTSLYFRDPAGNLLEITTPSLWGISEESLVISP